MCSGSHEIVMVIIEAEMCQTVVYSGRRFESCLCVMKYQTSYFKCTGYSVKI